LTGAAGRATGAAAALGRGVGVRLLAGALFAAAVGLAAFFVAATLPAGAGFLAAAGFLAGAF
jgi:hypothetical protein